MRKSGLSGFLQPIMPKKAARYAVGELSRL